MQCFFRKASNGSAAEADAIPEANDITKTQVVDLARTLLLSE